jgi:hypothetical protein
MFVVPISVQQTMLGVIESVLSDPSSIPDFNLHLFANNITPTSRTAFGDFVEAAVPESFDFWRGSAFENQLGGWDDISGSEQYVPGTPPPPDVIAYGAYASDLADSVLYFSGRFQTPIVFSDPFQGMWTLLSMSAEFSDRSFSASLAVHLMTGYSALLGESSMFIVPDVLMSPIMTALQLQLGTAVTGLVHIHLFTNNITPTKNNVLTDFVELTNVEVPGYAPASANWFAGVPHRLNSGAWECPSSLADPNFVCTTTPPPAPQIVYGWFATDSTDAILKGSGLFAAPYTFTQIGDGFTLPGNPELVQSSGGVLTLNMQDLEPN